MAVCSHLNDEKEEVSGSSWLIDRDGSRSPSWSDEGLLDAYCSVESMGLWPDAIL